MSEDARLIQTAVLDHPNSMRPIRLPVDRAAARRLRDARLGVFWCGYKLGGCGRPLLARIGEVLTPHFAHRPTGAGEERCGRSDIGESSADHLYVNRALSNWLTVLGFEVAGVDFRGLEDGRCTDMTIDLVGARQIQIVFRGADLDSWAERVLAAGRNAGPVLFGPGVDPPRALLKRFGFTITVDLAPGEEEQEVRLRTVRPDFVSEGRILSLCDYREDGIWTPERPLHTRFTPELKRHPVADDLAEAPAPTPERAVVPVEADRSAPVPPADARTSAPDGQKGQSADLFRFVLEGPANQVSVHRTDLVHVLAGLADDYLYDAGAQSPGPERELLLRRWRVCRAFANLVATPRRQALKLPNDSWLVKDLRSAGLLPRVKRLTVPPSSGAAASLFTPR